MSGTTTLEGPATVDRLFGRAHRALSVGAVALISLLAFEALAVATVMPDVARALDGLGLYALAFGGPFASSVVGMVAAGLWSDARGPRAPIRHGTAWFVLGLVIAGTAPAMGLFVLGRVVQGLGLGMLIVALYVVVGRAYPEQLRRKVFAAFAAAWVVPSLVGPAIAGLIAEYAGWRSVFLLVPLLAVPAALMIDPVLRALPSTVPDTSADAASPATANGSSIPATSTTATASTGPGGSRVPVQARQLGWALGAAVGAGLLHFAGQRHDPLGYLLLIPALVGLGICAPRLLPPGFVRLGRGLPTVIALRGLAGAAFVSAEVFIPLLLSRERGLTAALAGSILSIGALAWSLGSWIQGRLRPPASRAALPRIGQVMLVVGVGVLCLLVVPSIPVAVGVVGWALAGLGMGLVLPSLSVLTLDLSAPHEQGRNSSALQLCDSLFAATALAATGAMVAGGAGPDQGTYLAGFGISMMLGLIGVLLSGRVVPASTADVR